MADGSPLRGEIQDVSFSITGISEAGVNVTYVPIVKPDGTYRQRLVPGMYSFCCSTVTVLVQGKTFRMPLEAVGPLASKRRDAAEGVAQDFVWKVTGPTPYGQSQGLRPDNHTHWYGTSIGLRASLWRDDLRQAPPAVPAGTRLLLTLKPQGRSIDGRTLETLTLDRPLSSSDLSVTLHDLVPATYSLSGVAVLPDGTRRQLLFSVRTEQGFRYLPNPTLELEWDSMMQRPFLHRTDFVLD